MMPLYTTIYMSRKWIQFVVIFCDKEVAILIGPTLAIHLKVTWDSDVELFQWRLIWLIEWLVVDAWSGIPGQLDKGTKAKCISI